MNDALTCPHCALTLHAMKYGEKVGWMCPSCSGVAFNLSVLRDEIDSAVVARFWLQARAAAVAAARCPSCRRAMRLIEQRSANLVLDVDICVPCQSVWLDGGELDQIRRAAPRREPPRTERAVRVSRPALDRLSSPREPDAPADVRSVLERIISIIFTSLS